MTDKTPRKATKEADALFVQLSPCNWNEEWKKLQDVRHHRDSAEYWDERSKTYTDKDAPNQYVEDFLERADIRPGETVFDMGCGTGALSIPLGEAGHRVMAADFSSGMLKALHEGLTARHINTVFFKQMSWDDDWSEYGVTPNMADVCIASRSLAVSDMEDALLRLTDVAKRRVCITLATGSSPHADQRILRELGLESLPGRDYLYAFNILSGHGIPVEVSYILSERKDTYDTPEEAYAHFAKMIEREARESGFASERAAALKRLPDWLNSQLVPNENAGEPDKKGVPEKALRLARPRIISWAFLAWNK